MPVPAIALQRLNLLFFLALQTSNVYILSRL